MNRICNTFLPVNNSNSLLKNKPNIILDAIVKIDEILPILQGYPKNIFY